MNAYEKMTPMTLHTRGISDKGAQIDLVALAASWMLGLHAQEFQEAASYSARPNVNKDEAPPVSIQDTTHRPFNLSGASF